MNLRKLCSPRLALGAALLLGIAGTTGAQVVTIPWTTASFKGSIEIHAFASHGNCTAAYTVPTNVKFRITTLLLDSFGSSTPLAFQYLCSGVGHCTTLRSLYITAPVGSTLSVDFTSGIMINPGESIYFCNLASVNSPTSWSIYGFSYTS